MKVKRQHRIVNPSTEFVVAIDVSKDVLNCCGSYVDGTEDFQFEEELRNSTPVIEEKLEEYALLAGRLGLTLRVVCEATGGHEQKLLRTTRRLGYATALINPEHVSKLKNVESNDTGKTDEKDPRVMHLVTRLGKAQRHRQLPPEYQMLRLLTSFSDDYERAIASTRTRISALILQLFPDYDKSPDFTFDSTGRALMKAFRFNPYRIARAGYKRFSSKMKKHVRFVRFATLEHLYACADVSIRYDLHPGEIEILEFQLTMLWKDFERLTQRREALIGRIEEIGLLLQERGELSAIDRVEKGVTLFNLARLVGETGPLTDFHSKRAILRYAGVNIRERKSGRYKGQNRISKKGRPLLRKVLVQTIFPVLRKDRLFGKYYSSLIDRGMLQRKAKTAVMRKFLVMLYSTAKSGSSFDSHRVHNCESRHRAAA